MTMKGPSPSAPPPPLPKGRQLRANGRRKEALDEFGVVWLELRKKPPACTTAHFFGLLDDLAQAARESADGRARIAQWRDTLGASLTEVATLLDWCALNQVLSDEPRTLEWLETASRAVPGWFDVMRHQQLVELMARHGRWAALGRLVVEPLTHLSEVEELLGPAVPNWEGVADNPNAALHRLMREKTAVMARALDAAGRGADAEAVRAKALALDSSEEMREALGLSAAG